MSTAETPKTPETPEVPESPENARSPETAGVVPSARRRTREPQTARGRALPHFTMPLDGLRLHGGSGARDGPDGVDHSPPRRHPVRPALLNGGGPAVAVNLRHRPVTSA